MRLRYIFLFFAITITIYSHGQDLAQKIPFSKKVGDSKITYLKDYINSIEYVVLETRDECLIGKIAKVVAIRNHFLVQDWNNNLIVFNRSGDFLSKIGRFGHGPGEFLEITDFDFCRSDSAIAILDNIQKKIIWYKLDGSFINEKKIEHIAFNIGATENGIYLTYIPLQYQKGDSTSESFNILMYDIKGKLILKNPSTITKDYKGTFAYMTTCNFYKFENSLFYFEPFSDIIYRVNSINQLVPSRAIELGKYIIPQQLFTNPMKLRKEQKNYIQIGSICESQKHIFFVYLFNNVLYSGLFNKVEKTFSKCINRKGKRGFEHPYFHSLSFWPRTCSESGELVSYYNAIDIIESEKKSVEDHENNDLPWLKNINVDSNPILELVTFK